MYRQKVRNPPISWVNLGKQMHLFKKYLLSNIAFCQHRFFDVKPFLTMFLFISAFPTVCVVKGTLAKIFTNIGFHEFTNSIWLQGSPLSATKCITTKTNITAIGGCIPALPRDNKCYFKYPYLKRKLKKINDIEIIQYGNYFLKIYQWCS